MELAKKVTLGALFSAGCIVASTLLVDFLFPKPTLQTLVRDDQGETQHGVIHHQSYSMHSVIHADVKKQYWRNAVCQLSCAYNDLPPTTREILPDTCICKPGSIPGSKDKCSHGSGTCYIMLGEKDTEGQAYYWLFTATHVIREIKEGMCCHSIAIKVEPHFADIKPSITLIVLKEDIWYEGPFIKTTSTYAEHCRHTNKLYPDFIALRINRNSQKPEEFAELSKLAEKGLPTFHTDWVEDTTYMQSMVMTISVTTPSEWANPLMVNKFAAGVLSSYMPDQVMKFESYSDEPSICLPLHIYCNVASHNGFSGSPILNSANLKLVGTFTGGIIPQSDVKERPHFLNIGTRMLTLSRRQEDWKTMYTSLLPTVPCKVCLKKCWVWKWTTRWNCRWNFFASAPVVGKFCKCTCSWEDWLRGRGTCLRNMLDKIDIALLC